MLQEECKEKILSEEYRDFMMRDTGALGKNFPLENGCRIPLKYGFELFYIDQSEDRKKSLADYPYTMVPKCYTTLDMAAIQQAGIAAVQNIPGLELSGEGVLVGIIDTGINYPGSHFPESGWFDQDPANLGSGRTKWNSATGNRIWK